MTTHSGRMKIASAEGEREKKTKNDHSSKDESSYIFKVKYLKTEFECVWMIWGIIAKCFCFFILFLSGLFFGKGCI